jgi:hypothetical protein
MLEETMSLWADYIKESLSKNMIEDEKGFATFYIIPGTQVCYIEDIYVVPEARKSDKGTEMEMDIRDWAVAQGCSELMGSVNLLSNYPERSTQVLIARGYKIAQVTATMIYFKKNI